MGHNFFFSFRPNLLQVQILGNMLYKDVYSAMTCVCGYQSEIFMSRTMYVGSENITLLHHNDEC